MTNNIGSPQRIRPAKKGKSDVKASKDRPRRVRERKCLVTGESYPVTKLIRFVLGPDGKIVPDVAAKLPGRGGWILAERKVLESALKKKLFIRFGHRVLSATNRKIADVESLDDLCEGDANKQSGDGQPDRRKQKILVDENLLEIVEQLLRQRCLNYLGLVNRSGRLITGFEKVRSKLQAHKCRALITADDAADSGRSKLCSGLGNVLDKLRVIDMFTREELGQTLGLANAVHVALLPGGMTESFLAEFSRYEDVTMR